jgi:hypothetical protein
MILTVGLFIAQVAMMHASVTLLGFLGQGGVFFWLLGFLGPIVSLVALGQIVWTIVVLVRVRGLVIARARRSRRRKRTGPTEAEA